MPVLLIRREAAAQGIFGADARLNELEEILAAASLGADAGETEPAEGLAADQRPGDATVEIEIADTKVSPSALQVGGRAAEDATGEFVRAAVGDGQRLIE